ncbi:tRNA pseudouridine(38-40) synthase TruA [Paucihalobacter sp.]|uniref:tRNA pseudouridine(38-40) synthase TruA n=1 Tax=Paucihalobacter sp. TaxID=2850405 RepID=UPI003D1605C2
MRYFIDLAYNGTKYHGWQNQPNAVSVQETIERALSVLLQNPTTIVGAGRTDAGVHALQMVAHFDAVGVFDITSLVFKLNSYLPDDIVIYNIYEVNANAHARFDAISRTYHYKIAQQKNPFANGLAYEMSLALNIDNMNKASKLLLNHKDFQVFSKTHTDVKTYYCEISEAYWTAEDGFLIFTITADRFLRNMVRAIVGTMMNIGLGKTSLEQLHQIINSKDRSEAGFSAPACGLYLTHINYPEQIKLKL